MCVLVVSRHHQHSHARIKIQLELPSLESAHYQSSPRKGVSAHHTIFHHGLSGYNGRRNLQGAMEDGDRETTHTKDHRPDRRNCQGIGCRNLWKRLTFLSRSSEDAARLYMCECARPCIGLFSSLPCAPSPFVSTSRIFKESSTIIRIRVEVAMKIVRGTSSTHPHVVCGMVTTAAAPPSHHFTVFLRVLHVCPSHQRNPNLDKKKIRQAV